MKIFIGFLASQLFGIMVIMILLDQVPICKLIKEALWGLFSY